MLVSYKPLARLHSTPASLLPVYASRPSLVKLYIAAVYRCRVVREYSSCITVEQCHSAAPKREQHHRCTTPTRASINIAARRRRRASSTSNGRPPKIHGRGEGAPRRARQGARGKKKGAPEAEEGPDETSFNRTTNDERRPQDLRRFAVKTSTKRRRAAV